MHCQNQCQSALAFLFQHSVILRTLLAATNYNIMKKIQLTAIFRIHPGKLDAFKELSAKCVAAVKENEPQALQYDWFYTADQAECRVREAYADADAVFAHIANVGPYLAQFMTLADFSGEVYGNPPEALKKALDPFNATYYFYADGLEG